MNQINTDGISSLSLSAIAKSPAAETELVPHVSYPAQLTTGPSRDVALLKVANQAPISITLRDLPASIKELMSHEQVATLTRIGEAQAANAPSAGSPSAAAVAPTTAALTTSHLPLSATLVNHQGRLLLQLNSVAGLVLTPAQQLSLLQQFAGSSAARQPWDLTLTPRRTSVDAGVNFGVASSANRDPQASSPHASSSVTLRLQARAQLELSLLQQGKPQPLPLGLQRQWLGEVLEQLTAAPLQWRQLPSDIKQALIEQRPQLRHLPDNAAIQLRPSEENSALVVTVTQEERLPLPEPLRHLVARHSVQSPPLLEGRVELSAKAKAAIASEQITPAHMANAVHIASDSHASPGSAPLAPEVGVGSAAPAAPQLSRGVSAQALEAAPATDLSEQSPQRPKSVAGRPTMAPFERAQAPTGPGHAVSDSHQAPSSEQHTLDMQPSRINVTGLSAALAQMQQHTSANAINDPQLASALQKVLASVHPQQPQVTTEAQLQQELNAALTFHPLLSQPTPPSSAGALATAIQLLLGRLGLILPEPKPTPKTQQLKDTIHQLDANQSKELLKQLSAPALQYQMAQLDTIAQQKAELPSWCLTIPLPLAEQVQYGHCQIEQRHARRADGQQATLWHLTLSLDIPNHGALLMEASLGPDHNKLVFHTPSSSLKSVIDRFGTILRDRLKLQGVPITNFECHVGDIPTHLQTRGSALLQVKV